MIKQTKKTEITTLYRLLYFRQEIDIAMLGFMQSQQRKEDFTFLHPIGKDGMYIISKQNQEKVQLDK